MIRGRRARRPTRVFVMRPRRNQITYDYLITNDAEWTSTFALGAATLSGKTIAVAPGNYTSKTISSFNPAATVRVISSSASNKPQIDRILLDNASKLTFESLRIVNSTWAAGAINNGALQFSNAVSDIAVRFCDFVGNYRGTVGFAIDPNSNTYPEYACILPTFNSSGVITGFTVPRATTGDLMADGTYSMVFNNYGGVTFTVAPVATFTVSGGQITGTTLTSGGTSNASDTTGAGIRSALVTWTGQRPMASWLPSGWRCSGGTTVGGTITFEDNTFQYINVSLKPVGLSSSTTLNIRRNFFDIVYSDCISFGGQAACNIEDNFATRPFHNGDAGDAHTDFIQLIGGAADWSNIVIDRNILSIGNARGTMQGVFLDDTVAPNYLVNPRVVGNVILNRSNTNGISITRQRDGYVYRNLAARYDPTDPSNTGSLAIALTQDITYPTFVGDNIQEAGVVGSAGYNAVVLGLNGASIPYANVFADHAGTRTTRSEIASAYTPKPAYAGKGAFANTAYINHAAFSTNRSLEPSWWNFASVANQTTSSVSTSNWSRVRGGVDGRAISISGGEYRIADDESGTNATTWTSTASTVNVGKFVQVRVTNSVSGSTTTTATLTIGGYSNTFQSTTASVASFTSVDNQGLAYSATARPAANETNLRKIVMAVRFRADAITSGANIVAHSAASTVRFWYPSASSIRFQLLSSTRCRLQPSFVPTTGNTRTFLFTADFTNTTPNDGGIVATDLDGVLGQSGSVFDTRTVAGTGVDYGSFSFDLTTIGNLFSSSGSIGLFAEADGGGLVFDGALEFFYLDFGGSSYTLPDITDATVRNRWSADLIGANGQGPTGSTPKIYYTGNAAGWNAGLSNLGSLTLALTKGAGTYV